MGGGRVAPPIPNLGTPVTCPGVRTHRRSTPRRRPVGAGGPPPGIGRPPRATRPRPATGAGLQEMRRPATDGPRPQGSLPLVTIPARRRGSRHPVMTGPHPRITGGAAHPVRRPEATTARVHPDSRHLAGPAVRMRRRAVMAGPGVRACEDRTIRGRTRAEAMPADAIRALGGVGDAAVTLWCRPGDRCPGVVRFRLVGRGQQGVRSRAAGRAWTAT